MYGVGFVYLGWFYRILFRWMFVLWLPRDLVLSVILVNFAT